MNWLAELMLAGAAFVGHFSIAVWLFNRLHAVAWPRKVIKILEKALLLVAALVVVIFIFLWLVMDRRPFSSASPDLHWLWLAMCWVAAALTLPLWLLPKLRERTPAALLSNDTSVVDVAKRLGFRPLRGVETNLLARLPGNEILRVAIQRKKLRLPSLPPELDGLTIAHLSDLHMTGQLGHEFYDLVVDETNALQADLLVITGDILEKTGCLPWINQTLGRLQARHGKYFILGNHERRLRDPAVLRRTLIDAGLTDLGSRCERLTIHGVDVLLAGTELPWFGAALALTNSEFSIQHSALAPPAFRLLLSHSPDQILWARAHRFDLMLSGHNHGGQIRLPYLGALITPSLYGCRYAGGVYYEPPTLLHVSRGIAGIHLIRLNCPPEIALLVLTGA